MSEDDRRKGLQGLRGGRRVREGVNSLFSLCVQRKKWGDTYLNDHEFSRERGRRDVTLRSL